MSGVTLPARNGFVHLCDACLTSIRRTFPFHIPLYICAAVFCASSLLIARAFHAPVGLGASLIFLETIPKFLMLGVGVSAMAQLFILYRGGSDRPLAAMARWFHDSLLDGERPGNVFHSLIALTPLMIAFAALKDDIPLIHPFSWDGTFMHWDLWLGFGRLPSDILQPIVGHPLVTAALNINYDLWFVVMFGSLLWQSFAAKGGLLRSQFLLAFVFSWFIGGNVLAAAFSSAGPCFYGHFFAHDPYAAQMAYLRATSLHWPVWSVQVQDLLWQSYVSGTGAVSGISAMPSMHVMSSVLIMLLGFRTNKWLGAGMAVFTSLIVIGSVALAWHYAVDAIAGIALALGFWFAAGAIARATGKLTAPRAAA
jgi:hypothetical protein